MIKANAIHLMALMLFWSSPLAAQSGDKNASVAETIILDWTNLKEPSIYGFIGPTPAEYMKAINENKEVLRAKIVLNSSMKVEFTERPKDIDFYDSTIVVSRQGEASQSYNVGDLIKHQALSLAHIAIVPLGNGAGMLVCEYEGGFIGAREGFAVLRFFPGGFELHTLPLVDFGKVVVFRSKPSQATVWSALPYPRGTDAEPMAYTTQTCLWQSDGYQCSPPKRKRGLFGPAAINQPGIEIRP